MEVTATGLDTWTGQRVPMRVTVDTTKGTVSFPDVPRHQPPGSPWFQDVVVQYTAPAVEPCRNRPEFCRQQALARKRGRARSGR